MAWKFDGNRPIFQQISDIIILKIIKGEYLPGTKIDSVRDLATESGVNPNTMQRALAEIESTGIISTKRGEGRYVTENAEIISSFKEKYILEKTRNYVLSLEEINICEQEITEALQKFFNENRRKD